ncbi:MAG TPA: lytic transglycosylase domain-containing protein [Sphingopyxis sp.]|nr:lytic transglycosylase domain-containing protein [Sphingopyxis sp.]HMP43822.1 lytic transglycosylase domain-containing protein [Sphingopyxis sp.]HMQ20581.1 lytic transglycosylase domain-containing protein [Sphingopyxis sp.]
MAGLRIVAALFALAIATPARADPVDAWAPHIAEASARFGIPADWIRRVMRAESGGRTMLGGRPITSHAGAMGLMQLMPGTWAEMRTRLGLGRDPHHPRDNILAGTLYLRLMYDRFGYPGLFGAYNAGPARYADHLATGRRLPGETRAYLASVAGIEGKAIAKPPEARVSSLFFSLRTVPVPAEPPRHDDRSLFVPIGAPVALAAIEADR